MWRRAGQQPASASPSLPQHTSRQPRASPARTHTRARTHTAVAHATDPVLVVSGDRRAHELRRELGRGDVAVELVAPAVVKAHKARTLSHHHGPREAQAAQHDGRVRLVLLTLMRFASAPHNPPSLHPSTPLCPLTPPSLRPLVPTAVSSSLYPHARTTQAHTPPKSGDLLCRHAADPEGLAVGLGLGVGSCVTNRIRFRLKVRGVPVARLQPN